MVHADANKSMIKEAVEKMFPGTKVEKVNTINIDGKAKRRGMVVGKTAPVSYTHLDVYKRQVLYRCQWSHADRLAETGSSGRQL